MVTPTGSQLDGGRPERVLPHGARHLDAGLRRIRRSRGAVAGQQPLCALDSAGLTTRFVLVLGPVYPALVGQVRGLCRAGTQWSVQVGGSFEDLFRCEVRIGMEWSEQFGGEGKI